MNFLNETFVRRLKTAGILTEETIETWLQQGGSDHVLRKILIDNGLSKERLADQFKSHYGFSFYDLTTVRPQQLLLREDLTEWLFDYGVLPFYSQDGTILCAWAMPPDEKEQRSCHKHFGEEVTIVLGEQRLIYSHLYSQYHGTAAVRQEEKIESPDVLLDAVQNRREEPVDALIRSLLRRAALTGASDVHLAPEGHYGKADFRIEGELTAHTKIPAGRYEALVNKLKLLSGMDIAEKRLPQEGRFTISVDQNIYDVRSATLRLTSGEKLVLRLLPRKLTRTSLESVNFIERDLVILRRLLRRRQGLILVTGPTNSGKSTTLYTFLKYLSDYPLALYSVEDPVEAILPEINQVQVNRKSGLDFPVALRGILREDPDVILIGEIRDAETAQIAIRATLTGHLVLASLHAPHAQSVVERLRDLEVGDALLSVALSGVVNQRLLSALCPLCKGTGHGKNGLVCTHCRGSGQKGRLAVHEIWVPDEEDRQSIRARRDSSELRQACRSKGFRDLYENAQEKEKQGHLQLSALANAWFIEEVGDGYVSL